MTWLGHLKDQPGVRGLELGVWLGESTEWFLEHIATHETARMDGVDTFLGSAEHVLGGIDCSQNQKVAMARLERFGERVKLHQMTTDAFLLNQAWDRPSYDFVYIDAAHDARNVLRDAVLAFDLLKVGGVAVFDDYRWEVMADEVDRPKLAIDSFLSCYARQIEVLGIGWQVALKKTAP
jgi:hypothetical protein